MKGFHWLAYMQLLDSALPVGGFSHSFGLETAVQQGRVADIDGLKRYIRSMLFEAWGPGDAMAVRAVYRYAITEEWDRLWRVDGLLHASKAASESREGSRKMGRRLMQLARSIHPGTNWTPLEEAIGLNRTPGTLPLIHGWISRALGVPEEMAEEGYLYTCMVTAVNSALRLLPVGQTVCQALLAELLPLTAEARRRSEGMAPEDLYANTPEADIDMMNHETLYSRLFMS